MHARTGSYVLLHGGCTSTGCFAMTDPIIKEIFRLSRAALRNSQKRIQIHVFPFRMTAENLAGHADRTWQGFWANLKEAYDLFERTRLPPSVGVCNRRYIVSEARIDDDDCAATARVAEARRPKVAPARQFGHVVRNRPGRNARRAYAAARQARLAARAKAKQRHAQELSQRKLPR